MESDVFIPFRQRFVTKLSLISKEWSYSSQEVSVNRKIFGEIQSIAETGNPAVGYELRETNREGTSY